MRNRMGRLEIGGLLAAGLLFAGVWIGSTASGRSTAPSNLEVAFKKAQVNGKYAMLLRQFKVEKDAETYQDFKDLGFRETPEYAGQTDLPAGHWVYAAPYWYIWRDLTAQTASRQKRGWGPEQATGEPDTTMAGDIVTAWASATQDGQEEWLMLQYDEFVDPAAVLVYETYNPGALYRVTAYRPDGEEVEVWKGTDPTPTDAGMGLSEIPIRTDFKTNRVKIYLDSPSVPGWNEIDAVGLRDKAKKTHWAVAAEASTTYAPPFSAAATTAVLTEPAPFINLYTPQEAEKLKSAQKRIQKLEDEVRELKEAIEEIKKPKTKGQ